MPPRLPFLPALILCTTTAVNAQDAARTAPRDTLDAAAYQGWQQFSLNCARCHGDEALGTTFGPNLLVSLRPEGPVPTREAFIALLTAGRPARGMPSAATMGVAAEHFDGLYAYLSGRSAGRLHGGRPARRAP